MYATEKELINFFHHCHMRERLADDVDGNTVTNSYRLHSVRKATDCWTGKKGVRYASEGARVEKSQRFPTKPWHECGLVKEHAVPVSEINKRVATALIATQAEPDPDSNARQLLEAEAEGLPSSVLALFRQHPRVWIVARVIREWTLHAWITKTEEERFDDKEKHGKSIRNCMPTGWKDGDDRFQRYIDSGIKVTLI